MSVSIGPIKGAAEWFEAHADQLFDWLEIPVGDEISNMFRKQAILRIVINLKLERWEGERFMDAGLFREQMYDLLRNAGYKRPSGVDRYSIKSLKSSACLERLWEFCRSHTMGYCRWKNDMTPEGLENEPAHELVSDEREMALRWSKNNGWVSPNGQMIAHKTDQIWVSLSDFGLPWPPYTAVPNHNTRLSGITVYQVEDGPLPMFEDSLWKDKCWWE